jgi:hypothetical protein
MGTELAAGLRGAFRIIGTGVVGDEQIAAGAGKLDGDGAA